MQYETSSDLPKAGIDLAPIQLHKILICEGFPVNSRDAPGILYCEFAVRPWN
jgi:hypothetical protein